MKHYSLGIILYLCLVILIPVNSYAQLPSTQDDIGVEMIPANPGPNEKVSVKISSYSIDLNSSAITWSVNGSVAKNATGDKNFMFTTSSFGQTTKLSITARTSDGEIITKNISINPSSVDLVWESEGLVPPFFKGKALFSHQNQITFIAIPHIYGPGGEIPAKKLIYKWSKNGSVVEETSGFGKDTYTFTGNLISRPFIVEVEVSSPEVVTVGYGASSASPIEPIVVLYKKSPVYGIELQREISSTELLNEPEITIVAIPLFFGASRYDDPGLSYKWRINGKPTGGILNQNVQIFRPQEKTVGSASISLSLENKMKVFQLANKSFNLNFDNSNQ